MIVGQLVVDKTPARYEENVAPDILDNSFTVVDFANGVRAMLDLCMFADGTEHQEEISATGDAARLDVLIPPGDLVFPPASACAPTKRWCVSMSQWTRRQ